jgi:quercetin dioxygenase-like cupin family protein
MSAFEATVLLRSEQTAGAIGAIEVRVPAGWEGPPLHHHAFDEAFCVLDGELTFQLGEELVTARAGSSR